MNVDINPCPCGNEYPGLASEYDCHGRSKDGCVVHCLACGRRTKLHRRPTKAVKAWNAQYETEITFDKRVLLIDIR